MVTASTKMPQWCIEARSAAIASSMQYTVMRMETTPATSGDPRAIVLPQCPLCHGGQFREYVNHPELQWVICDCGLIYKRAQLASISMDTIYQESYFTGGVYDTRLPRRIQKSRHQLLDVLNHVEPGPALDIGCSLGYVLQAARQLGLESTGADVSEFAAQACREQGFDARQGTMGALPFEDGRFAIVTMKHVLEHTPDPRGALRDVRRVLRPHGGLFIAVPDSRYGRAARNPHQSRFYLPSAKGIQHFIYYTPATLARLLEEEGFRVTRVNPHIVHRYASVGVRALQTLTAPLRIAAQAMLDGLKVRKEFWLTAVRTD